MGALYEGTRLVVVTCVDPSSCGIFHVYTSPFPFPSAQHASEGWQHMSQVRSVKHFSKGVPCDFHHNNFLRHLQVLKIFSNF